MFAVYIGKLKTLKCHISKKRKQKKKQKQKQCLQ